MAARPESLPFEFDRHGFVLRFRRRFPSARSSIVVAVAQVMRIARQCGCGGSDLEIAVREALANAIIHGNGDRPEKWFRLRCYGKPGDGVVVAIRDQGDGFDPDRVPDPRREDRRFLDHGRGLLLMRELLDHIAYLKGGREVVLYKSCSETSRS